MSVSFRIDDNQLTESYTDDSGIEGRVAPPSQNSVELLVMNVADDSGYSSIISMLQIECIL